MSLTFKFNHSISNSHHSSSHKMRWFWNDESGGDFREREKGSVGRPSGSSYTAFITQAGHIKQPVLSLN